MEKKTTKVIESSNFKQPKIDGEIKEIVEQRKLLPIFSGREKFIQEAKQHDSIILVGETGSGKTTQIPQYLFEHRLHRRNNNKGAFRIAITQPRRVAAVTLSKRVNEEVAASRNSPIFSKNIGNRKTDELCDSQVGYKVRFEDSTDPEKTIMIFQTDGMLRREAMLDPLLSRYSWIILDEAHERKIETDILFGVIKNIFTKRDFARTHRQTQRMHSWIARDLSYPGKLIRSQLNSRILRNLHLCDLFLALFD